MRRDRGFTLAIVAALALTIGPGTAALAADGRDCTPPVYTPIGGRADITTRIFNDCPSSTVTTGDSYPGVVWIKDIMDPACDGYANLHIWDVSDDGVVPATFENCSMYGLAATFVLEGAHSEGGLRLSPWWSPNVEGRFMVNTATGEVACFGGRLPYYSFTAAYGVHYEPDLAARLEIVYNPGGLQESYPATIQYSLTYQGHWYLSPPFWLDQGNPAEDPPHGLWGQLYPTRVGGYFQPQCTPGEASYGWANWWGIRYLTGWAAPTRRTSWGGVKAIYR